MRRIARAAALTVAVAAALASVGAAIWALYRGALALALFLTFVICASLAC